MRVLLLPRCKSPPPSASSPRCPELCSVNLLLGKALARNVAPCPHSSQGRRATKGHRRPSPTAHAHANALLLLLLLLLPACHHHAGWERAVPQEAATGTTTQNMPRRVHSSGAHCAPTPHSPTLLLLLLLQRGWGLGTH